MIDSRDRWMSSIASFSGAIVVVFMAATISGCATELTPPAVSSAKPGNELALKERLSQERGLIRGPRTSVKIQAEQAENGNVESQIRVAVSYYIGSGAPVNYEEARNWFAKASENNDKKAQYCLAYMFEHGEGGEPDLENAFRWYLAAAEGHDDYSELAEKDVKRLSETIGQADQDRLRKEVLDWFNMSNKRKTKLEKKRRPY